MFHIHHFIPFINNKFWFHVHNQENEESKYYSLPRPIYTCTSANATSKYKLNDAVHDVWATLTLGLLIIVKGSNLNSGFTFPIVCV